MSKDAPKVDPRVQAVVNTIATNVAHMYHRGVNGQLHFTVTFSGGLIPDHGLEVRVVESVDLSRQEKAE